MSHALGLEEVNQAHGALRHHYTSLDALFSILSGKELWATDIRFMNDSSEGISGRQQLRIELEGEIDWVRSHRQLVEADELYASDNPDEWIALLEQAASEVVATPNQTYVPRYSISFSGDGDSITQWRAYAPSGCCLSVDLSELVESREVRLPSESVRSMFGEQSIFDMQIRVIKMLYGSNGLNQLVEKVRNEWTRNGNTTSSLASGNSSGSSFIDFIRNEVHSLKDESFRSELETRLLVQPDLHGGNPPHKFTDHRLNGKIVVPYVAVPIRVAAVKQIRLAPPAAAERDLAAVQEAVRMYYPLGAGAPLVLNSTIPRV